MPDDLLGTVLNGKYRLDGILGMGAMGVVYRAAQLDAEGEVRAVAVKMIRPGLLSLGADVTARFLREIRAAAKLRGPNTVTVYDFGESASGDLYYVMEVVEGPTLKEVIATAAPLPPDRVVAIGTQICSALDEAHHLTPPVFHRDLKPGNVFVEKWPDDVWVRVGDFGIAKVAGDETYGVTGAGWSPGAPGYMAPEQCRGAEVDSRADLYALGVVLYEAASGRPPFTGDAMTVMYQHVYEPPPPLPPAVAPELRRLIERLLAKEPDARPSSARQVRADLEAAEAALGRARPAIAPAADTTAAKPAMTSDAVKPLQRRGMRLGAAAVGLSVLAVMAIFAARVLRPSDRDRPADSVFQEEMEAGTRSGLAAEMPAVAQSRGLRPEQSLAGPPTIAVLEFRNERAGDSEHDWIRTALQTTFSTELNKIRELRVLSRELVEESAPAAVPSLQRLRRLGARKLVSGSFTVLAGKIRVDARIVDVESGMQEKAESIEGGVNEFFGLQKRLALTMLEHLPVQVSERERESIAERNPSENQGLAFDAYRLMLQGEGLVGEEEDEEEEADDDLHSTVRTQPSLSSLAVSGDVPRAQPSSYEMTSHRSVFICVHLWFRSLLSEIPSAAYADDQNGAEAEVRAVLEQYRVALEKGDLDGISQVRGKLSERRRKGLEEYFKMAEDLKVHFDRVEIRPIGDKHFEVSYLRRDAFSDRRTGERVSLEVQLENAAVHDGETWRIKNRKPLAAK
jgi:TolB-like protein